MSEYLVAPIKGHWKNQQKLAAYAGVAISEEERKIGEAVFAHKPNIFPVARPQVVKVNPCFGPTDPSTYDSIFSSTYLPAHPAVLLTLMSGIGDEEETEHLVWTYRTVASTLLLAHPSGQVYTFLIDGGQDSKPKWKARFLPADRGIGRSMYIHQYPDKVGFNLFRYFLPDAEGKYGRFVTCFD